MESLQGLTQGVNAVSTQAHRHTGTVGEDSPWWWEQSVGKAEQRLQVERQRLKEVRERMGRQVALQRAFFAALTQLQEECAKGEQLEMRVEKSKRSDGEQEQG